MHTRALRTYLSGVIYLAIFFIGYGISQNKGKCLYICTPYQSLWIFGGTIWKYPILFTVHFFLTFQITNFFTFPLFFSSQNPIVVHFFPKPHFVHPIFFLSWFCKRHFFAWRTFLFLQPWIVKFNYNAKLTWTRSKQ